jgi:ABC-2 type transport system ATP-binding protein
MMTGRKIIDIRELTKIYKSRMDPAVHNLSLEIFEGEIFGIIGPNGAGKTTIISVLCGLLSASSGNIIINGYNLKNDLTEIKKVIGVVSQDIALYDKLTAYENLYYFGSLFSIDKIVLKERIGYFLSRLGLEKFKDERIRNFSGGMKRRINLLAGVLHNPKLLFLDEPTTGVDVQSRNVIREFLTELNNFGTTMIYTSHLMDDVEKLCSRISIIDYGEIIITGVPCDLIAQHHDCNTLEDLFLKLTGRHLRD